MLVFLTKISFQSKIKYKQSSVLLNIEEGQTALDIISLCKQIASLELGHEIGSLGLYYGKKEIPINSKMKDYKGKLLDFEIKQKYQTVCFSTPGIDARMVVEDFNIYYNESVKICKWRLEPNDIITDSEDLEYCKKYVSLYLDRTSRRLEKSRGFIVTAIALAALNAAKVSSDMLVFDYETKLECVIKDKLYTGNTDMALVHSLMDGSINDDSCILVIGAKQGTSFEKGLGQVIAQAATAFKMIEMKRRGVAQNGLSIFMIRSDGLRWQFGMLSQPKEKFLLKTCYPITIDETTDIHEFDESLGKVFSWFVKIVREISISSPRLQTTFE